jgi:hypothetical protein
MRDLFAEARDGKEGVLPPEGKRPESRDAAARAILVEIVETFHGFATGQRDARERALVVELVRSRLFS